MVNQPKPKPQVINVIGWVWIGLGTLMLLSGTGAFMVDTFAVKPEFSVAASSRATSMSDLDRLYSLVFDHFSVLTLAQMCVASFVVYSAVMFLRLRSWARSSLEVVTWLGLLFTVVWGGVLIWVQGFPSQTGPASSGVSAGWFLAIDAVIGTVVFLCLSAPLVVLLRLLRGRAVRDAFKQAPAAGSHTKPV